MKRILSVLVSFVILFSLGTFAFADIDDIDLTGLTLEELVELKQRITTAMWETEDWQEVTVPCGTYEIGKDIPAGHWTIRPLSELFSEIKVGDKVEEHGAAVAYSSKNVSLSIYAKNSGWYRDGAPESFDVVLNDGWYIEIDRYSVIFTPYVGKPDLGFK